LPPIDVAILTDTKMLNLSKHDYFVVIFSTYFMNCLFVAPIFRHSGKVFTGESLTTVWRNLLKKKNEANSSTNCCHQQTIRLRRNLCKNPTIFHCLSFIFKPKIASIRIDWFFCQFVYVLSALWRHDNVYPKWTEMRKNNKNHSDWLLHIWHTCMK